MIYWNFQISRARVKLVVYGMREIMVYRMKYGNWLFNDLEKDRQSATCKNTLKFCLRNKIKRVACWNDAYDKT